MIQKMQLLVTVLMLIFTSTIQADSVKLNNSNNGHSYQRLDVALNWNAAKNICAYLGAHLATITTNQEDEWIQVHLTNESSCLWLGGTDAAQEGIWTWITGETITAGASGASPGAVDYSVSVNASGVLRTGALTIARQTLIVAQKPKNDDGGGGH